MLIVTMSPLNKSFSSRLFYITLLLLGVHGAIFPNIPRHSAAPEPGLHSPADQPPDPAITPGPLPEELRKRVDPFIWAVPGFSYLGCWSDGSNHIFSPYDVFIDVVMKPELCRNLCAKSTWPAFGVTGGSVCLCGHRIETFALSAAETECSSSCLGNPVALCGGLSKMNIYSATTGSNSGTKTGSWPFSTVALSYPNISYMRVVLLTTFSDI
jgi:hypothetical protein